MLTSSEIETVARSGVVGGLVGGSVGAGVGLIGGATTGVAVAGVYSLGVGAVLAGFSIILWPFGVLPDPFTTFVNGTAGAFASSVPSLAIGGAALGGISGSVLGIVAGAGGGSLLGLGYGVVNDAE